MTIPTVSEATMIAIAKEWWTEYDGIMSNVVHATVSDDDAVATIDRDGWLAAHLNELAIEVLARRGRQRQSDIAEAIARAAHAGQVEESTGADYIQHVQRVVCLATSDEQKTVAWLHDVIEDARPHIDALDLVAAGITPTLARSVLVLTRDSRDTYADYIDKVLSSKDAIAIAVKRADLIDHLRPNCPERLRPRYEAAWPRFQAAVGKVS